MKIIINYLHYTDVRKTGLMLLSHFLLKLTTENSIEQICQQFFVNTQDIRKLYFLCSLILSMYICITSVVEWLSYLFAYCVLLRLSHQHSRITCKNLHFPKNISFQVFPSCMFLETYINNSKMIIRNRISYGCKSNFPTLDGK